MTKSSQQQTLQDRLEPRIAVEERFERTGRRFRKKSFFFRHEKIFIRFTLKLGLQLVGLYRRGVQNALRPVVKDLRLSFPNLPAALDGFRILHLSDLHIDKMDGLVEALKPVLSRLPVDLCVITGDYRFEDRGPCQEVYPRIRALLPSIVSKHGTYAILGNHDVAEIAYELDRMGIRMLINEAVQITKGPDSLWLAGVDDPFDFRTDDLPGALESVPPNSFKVLLAHSPDLYTEAAAGGVSLYLCGHTHAGQIRLPVVGSIRHNADCPKEFSYGHWTYGDMHGYTSSGIGCSGLPIRYNCAPEVIVIELRRG